MALLVKTVTQYHLKHMIDRDTSFHSLLEGSLLSGGCLRVEEFLECNKCIWGSVDGWSAFDSCSSILKACDILKVLSKLIACSAYSYSGDQWDIFELISTMTVF